MREEMRQVQAALNRERNQRTKLQGQVLEAVGAEAGFNAGCWLVVVAQRYLCPQHLLHTIAEQSRLC